MSLVDAIPQSIRAVGAAKAQGVGAGGAYGGLIADIGQSVGQIPAQMAAKKSRDMQLQISQMQLDKEKRDQAADVAFQNATRNALNPDGSFNTTLLTEQLAGTPAATKIPTILEQFNRMQESAANLRLKTIDAQQAEDDVFGALAHAADQADDPADKAAILAAGLAAAQKNGTVRPERAKETLSSVLTADGQPDPARVGALIKQLTAGSKQQRTLAESEARANALNEDRKAQQAEREERTRSTALRNFSSQLGSATTQQDYARRFAGVPAEFQSYFDAPDQWTPETGQRALQVALTPAERLSIQTQERLAAQAKAQADRQAEADRRAEAAAAETARHNRATEGLTARRLESEGDGGDKKADEGYKQFVSQYDKARTEERERATKVPANPQDPLSPMVSQAPAYQPPPSREKWNVMTPTERAAALRDPNARINDAELTRRLGGGGAPVATAAPAAAKVQVKVGDVVVTNSGQRRRITAIHPDGTASSVEVK